MSNPMTEAFANLQEEEDTSISFPFKHEGKWHQAELLVGGDNTLAFLFDGVRTEVGLSQVAIMRYKRK